MFKLGVRIRFPRPERGMKGSGESYIRGHVEIYHDGQWGTICDDSFDDRAAKVICRMAGYSQGKKIKFSRYQSKYS